MFECVIPMYGIPREITEQREVKVKLRNEATMAEVVAAMKEKIPSLEGPVFRAGENRLNENYKFNINGNFYYAGMDFNLKNSDRIALLMPVTGG